MMETLIIIARLTARAATETETRGRALSRFALASSPWIASGRLDRRERFPTTRHSAQRQDGTRKDAPTRRMIAPAYPQTGSPLHAGRQLATKAAAERASAVRS